MSRATLIVLALIAAFAGGTASAAFSVANWLTLAGQRSGAWQRLTAPSGMNADPYWRVFEHLSGQLPIGSAEGQAYLATGDDDGQPLDHKCDYLLEGEIPAARLFTLRAETFDGQWIQAKPPFQSALHSDEMLFVGNRYAVNISASAKPDNWLALKATTSFQLILTYYDVAVINDDTGNSTRLPRIQKRSCSDA